MLLRKLYRLLHLNDTTVIQRENVFDVHLLCVFTVISGCLSLDGMKLTAHLLHLALMIALGDCIEEKPPTSTTSDWMQTPTAGKTGSRLDMLQISLFTKQ